MDNIIQARKEYGWDVSLCCICKNLTGTYMEQHHEADNHCKIQEYNISSNKKYCPKYKKI